MQTHPECLPCFVNQAVSVLQRLTIGRELSIQVLRNVIREIADFDLSRSPPSSARLIYRTIERLTGSADPYSKEKSVYNRLALGLAEKLNREYEGRDPFSFRLRCAMAANLIDFGAHGSLDEESVGRFLVFAASAPVDDSAIERLRRAVNTARNILYICDNAGEIVFDRYFIECLPGERVTAVVRGAPVINDATMEDARQAGLRDAVAVIDNGFDAPGTVLGECSGTLRDRFASADLVISKGQGNFETLDEVKGKRIFFLLTVKCAVVETEIGHARGSLVIHELCS